MAKLINPYDLRDYALGSAVQNTLSARIALLLANKYNGSIADMANAVGMSTTSVYRMAKCKSKVTDNFVERLRENVPDVNMDWFLADNSLINMYGAFTVPETVDKAEPSLPVPEDFNLVVCRCACGGTASCRVLSVAVWAGPLNIDKPDSLAALLTEEEIADLYEKTVGQTFVCNNMACATTFVPLPLPDDYRECLDLASRLFER